MNQVGTVVEKEDGSLNWNKQPILTTLTGEKKSNGMIINNDIRLELALQTNTRHNHVTASTPRVTTHH